MPASCSVSSTVYGVPWLIHTIGRLTSCGDNRTIHTPTAALSGCRVGIDRLCYPVVPDPLHRNYSAVTRLETSAACMVYSPSHGGCLTTIPFVPLRTMAVKVLGMGIDIYLSSDNSSMISKSASGSVSQTAELRARQVWRLSFVVAHNLAG